MQLEINNQKFISLIQKKTNKKKAAQRIRAFYFISIFFSLVS